MKKNAKQVLRVFFTGNTFIKKYVIYFKIQRLEVVDKYDASQKLGRFCLSALYICMIYEQLPINYCMQTCLLLLDLACWPIRALIINQQPLMI